MKKLTNLFALSTVCLAGTFAFTSVGYAATKAAASCSYNDVSTAVASAATGDTVTVPAGSCSWSSTLKITKGISVIGAGKAETIITNNAGTAVSIIKTQNDFVRLSGFRFNNSDKQTPIISIIGPTFKARIDNITVNKGDAAIGTNWSGSGATGPVYGVVDSSEFYNTSRAYFAMDVRSGDREWGKGAWNEYLGNEKALPGSDNMMIFEDNKFIWDNSLTNKNAQGALYGQYGGKVTFRYNDFSGFCTYIDGHGDLGAGQDYGTIYYEIYNNTFKQDNTHCSQGNIVWMRGGKLIAHDNTFTGGSLPFRMSVYYESDIASHRVNNTYYWANKWNGNSDQASMVKVTDSGQTSSGYSANNIKLNQQYFLKEPESYKPYTYPHPLRSDSGSSTKPAVTLLPPVLHQPQ
ncbi:hypothetical protein V2P20_02660 [Methylobacter sp. Wu1]|uniref:hypothetical protein n=1 Tax=Methylobacter sp. Wu1 TaxID=3119359 RepID=UPI002F9436E0